jgi:hypothetical protein
VGGHGYDEAEEQDEQDDERRATTTGHATISFPIPGRAEHTSAMGAGMVERPP